MTDLQTALPKRNIQWYGWKPDLPSSRDRYMTPEPGLALPPSIDLRSAMEFMPPYDQGEEGSCTANAIAGALQYQRKIDGKRAWMPSRQFIYYGERVIEDSVDYDSGAMIRDGITVVSKVGYCHERLWPYRLNDMAEKPSQDAYDDAANHTILGAQRVGLPDGGRTLNLLKQPLAKGRPIIFGFTVYPSFESDEVARSGIVPMPGSSERSIGGHAVLASGYDDSRRCLIVRNSWNTNWGDGGYFYFPYDYALDPNLSDDFWDILAT